MSRLEYKSLLTAVQSNNQDPKSILIGAKDEIIEWDTRTAKPCKIFKSHIGQVTHVVLIRVTRFHFYELV